MVLTRSRGNSATRSGEQREIPSATGDQYPGHEAGASGEAAAYSHVHSVTPPQAGRPESAGEYAPPSSFLHGREQLPGYLHASPSPLGQPPPVASGQVVMSDQQLLFLLNSLRAQPPVVTPPTSVSSNLSNCTARYDGTGDVVAFIDAVQIYKDCVGVVDDIALRGLPMLFTGFAATWYQGVKYSVNSWGEAMTLLRQTFGPRLPPPRIYREIFSREQGEERTDVFVCRLRALIAQLPPNTLPENPVQLDMVYGLLNRRKRERVPRSSVASFTQLLQQARAAEDVLEEGRSVEAARARNMAPAPLPPVGDCSLQGPSAAACSPLPKIRPRCVFCKSFGHSKDTCRKLAHKTERSIGVFKTEPTSTPPEQRPSLTCFGCGAPGVIRSNCTVCKESRSPTPSITSSFQSVSVCAGFDPRVRPICSIEVLGVIGTALLDTGAKQSVASVSLTRHLRSNGQRFERGTTELKFADGSQRVETVETTSVTVKLHGVEIKTLFMVLPGATESLLGMNFIRDAGMVLDFGSNRYRLQGTQYYELRYERDQRAVVSSQVGLRECEETRTLVRDNANIFSPGGGPTQLAVHKIDTADAAPISTPPYRVNPNKKEIIRYEIDKMLELDIIKEADPNKVQTTIAIKPPISLKQLSKFLQTRPRGRNHTSLLTPYTGDMEPIVHNRRRGRPRKDPDANPAPSSSTGLEGEDIARVSNSCSSPPLLRRSLNVRAHTWIPAATRTLREPSAPSPQSVYAAATYPVDAHA